MPLPAGYLRMTVVPLRVPSQELTYLYREYDEHDNAALCMIHHSTVAWDHVDFKDVIAKLSNQDMYYKGLKFYLEVSSRWSHGLM